MLILAYDTETSGLPLWNDPSEDPRQPHIVELAALLVDEESREVVETLHHVVRPDGWEIPDDVAAIHGITTALATERGVPEKDVVDAFYQLHQRAARRLAHNESFDQRIVRIGLKRFGYTDEQADTFKAAPASCTQKLSTPILALPPTAAMKAARRFHHKSANLGEAFQYFTGKPLEGAHSAMVDVQACLTVFWAIKDRGRAAA